jgi:hypothetical protein
MKMKWSKKFTRYYQIVSKKNKVKTMLFSGFCDLNDEELDDCIFITESIIEFNLYASKRWRTKGTEILRLANLSIP